MNTHSLPARRPLVPEDLQRRPRDYLARAAGAHLLARINGGSPEAAAETLFGKSDEPTRLVLRSATSPATMTASGWASELARASVGSFIGSLAPSWASGRLISQGLKASLDGVSSLLVPEVT